MTPQVYDFIPGSLEYTDKYIEIADGNHVTEKQKVQFHIKICDDNRDNFIATLHNVLLAPDLCNYYINTCLFYKGVFTVYFGDKGVTRLLYHIVHRGIMYLWGK